jgi:ferric-dicitrate binding protein FerR (iron transport regulator)
MLSTEYLKKLLDDFISGRISRDDAEELFNIINNKDIDSKIMAWLYMKWDESSPRSTGFHSEGIYEKIRKNLNLPPKSIKEERDYVNYMIETEATTNHRVIRSILKFAAVFILAAGTSFFLFRYTNSLQKIMEENYTEIKIENGSKSTIVLPDNTTIKLNSGSYLKYPDHFSGENRQVFLEGEAFFEVSPGQSSPFYVKTGNISIKVTGTKFNVKSFPEDHTIETTLISGSIIIEELNHDKYFDWQTVLNPNQLAVYNKRTNEINVLDLTVEEELTPAKPIRVASEPIISRNAIILTAWKDNKFIFYNEQFGDLALRLERWYNVDIIITNEELKNYRFTGSFTTENIEQALEALKLASSFEYKIIKNQITITR